MTESIPIWNDDDTVRDITAELSVAGFGRDDTRDPTPLRGRAHRAAQVERVLEDLAAAESWEAMAVRSVTRSKAQRRHSGRPPATTPLRKAS